MDETRARQQPLCSTSSVQAEEPTMAVNQHTVCRICSGSTGWRNAPSHTLGHTQQHMHAFMQTGRRCVVVMLTSVAQHVSRSSAPNITGLMLQVVRETKG